MTTLSGSIQQEIDTQNQDPDQPLGNICITGGSGSFQLPKGARVTLRQASGFTLSGNDGDNQIDLIQCSDFSIVGVQDIIIRCEQCSGIQSIQTSGNAQLNIAVADIELLDLTATKAFIADCQVEQATLASSSLMSRDNTFTSATISGGDVQSENDTYTTAEISNSAVLNAFDLTSETLTVLTKGICTLQTPEIQELVNTGGYVTSVEGDHESINATVEAVTVLVNGTITGDVTSNASKLVLDSGTVSGEVEITQGTVVSTNTSFESTIEVTEASATLSSATFKTDLTLVNSATRLFESTLTGDITVTGGSLDSENNQYQGNVGQAGGTFTSINDTFEGTVETLLLTAGNKLWKPTGPETLTMSGSNSGSSLEIDKATGIEILTLTAFARLNVSGCSVEQLNAAMSSLVHLDNCEVTAPATFTSISIALLDNCTFDQVTATDVFTFIAPSSTIANLILTSANLAVTDQVESAIATDANIIDSTSNYTTVTGGVFIGRNSNITSAVGTLVSINGGSVSATNSLVTGLNSNITNDSLTLSVNGNPVQSAACLDYTAGVCTLNTSGQLVINGDLGIAMTSLQGVTIVANAISATGTATLALQAPGIAVQGVGQWQGSLNLIP